MGTPHVAPRSPASGSDATGSVTVSIDGRGLVESVEISSLPADLRGAAQMTAAFEEALTSAHGNAYPAAPPPAGVDRVKARRVERPERRPMRSIVEEALRTQRDRPGPSGSVIGGEQGVSDNGCVTVVLDRTGPTGEIAFDQGWLRNASATNIGSAIGQAFAAAYDVRGAR